MDNPKTNEAIEEVKEEEGIFGKFGDFISNDFKSPFSRRPLSIVEKLRIAAGDLLYVYNDEVIRKDDPELAERIDSVIFGKYSAANALEIVSTAIAKAYTLLMKISELFEVPLYERYDLFRFIKFGEVELDLEKNVFRFSVELGLTANSRKTVAIPAKIYSSVVFKDTVMNEFDPETVTKAGKTCSRIIFSPKLNIDQYTASVAPLSEDVTVNQMANDVIVDLTKSVEKFNNMLCTYLTHVGYDGLRDIRNSKCAMCGKFGNKEHCCDPLHVYDPEDEGSKISKDKIITALEDVFKYFSMPDVEEGERDEFAESTACWKKHIWFTSSDTESDILSFVFNETFDHQMNFALQYILNDITEGEK